MENNHAKNIDNKRTELKVVDFYTSNGNPSNKVRNSIKDGTTDIMVKGLKDSGLHLKPNTKGDKVLYDTVAKDTNGDEIYMVVKISITTKHPDTPPTPKDGTKAKVKENVATFTLG